MRKLYSEILFVQRITDLIKRVTMVFSNCILPANFFIFLPKPDKTLLIINNNNKSCVRHKIWLY